MYSIKNEKLTLIFNWSLQGCLQLVYIRIIYTRLAF